jgi:hypothetical protein
MAYMYSFNPTAHNLWLLYLFLVVIVGGVGSVFGSAAAGLIIGLIIGLSGAFFSERWVNVLLFGLLMVIILIKPEGLSRSAAKADLSRSSWRPRAQPGSALSQRRARRSLYPREHARALLVEPPGEGE